jgi:hypothetical protein
LGTHLLKGLIIDLVVVRIIKAVMTAA